MTDSPSTPASNDGALERLARSGLLEGCRIASGEKALVGSVRLDGHVVRLRVLLPATFPLCLPVVVLEDCQPPHTFPHVFNKSLCYEAQEELLLDRRDPWGILRESVERALETLRAGLTEEGTKEFVRELLVYWNRLAGQSAMESLVTVGERPAAIVALFDEQGPMALADSAQVYAKALPSRHVQGVRSQPAVYIPIDPAAVNPLFRPESLCDAAALRRYVRALPESDRKTLQELLSRRTGLLEWVALGVRRPEGERCLVGLCIMRRTGGHPLLDDRALAVIAPVSLLRRDPGFLAPRGGARTELAKCRVLVAGCGSVGGYIALALARAGVGSLTLVDNDKFEWENTYRHACGMAYVGAPKAEGLQRELHRLVPFVTVTPNVARIEEVLRDKPNVVHGQNLVISALGNPAVELFLNEEVWAKPQHPPTLFAWVEPLGLGGHVLSTRARGPAGPVRGCLECLYDRPVQGGALQNRAAFAAPGAHYTRDVAGCGTRYLPFGDLDAQRTAELAARQAIRVLRGEVNEAPLLSWKGDRHAFEQAGFKVTPRYEMSLAELEAARLGYIQSECTVCGT